MLFKQFALFQLTQPIDWSLQTWQERLAQLALKPCGQHEAQTHGWGTPHAEASDQLVIAHSHYRMFAMHCEQKVIPPQVVREHADRKCKEIAAAEGRKLGAQEKRSIRDETTFALLPKAFVQTKVIHAIADTQQNWIMISATSSADIKLFTQFAAKLFGPKVLQPYPMPQNLNRILTGWLLDGPDAPFECGTSCQLFDPKRTARVIACRNCDIQSTPILNHVEQGYWASKLGLVWRENVSFELGSDWTFKQIKFHDQLRETFEADADVQSQVERDIADFMLTADTLSSLLQDLLPLLGGASYQAPVVVAEEEAAAI